MNNKAVIVILVVILLIAIILANLILQFIGIEEYEAIYLQDSNEPALLIAGTNIIVEASVGAEHPTETIFISNIPDGRVIKPSFTYKKFLNKNPCRFPIKKHDNDKNIWVDLSSVGEKTRHIVLNSKVPDCSGELFWKYDTQKGFYSGEVVCKEK